MTACISIFQRPCNGRIILDLMCTPGRLFEVRGPSSNPRIGRARCLGRHCRSCIGRRRLQRPRCLDRCLVRENTEWLQRRPIRGRILGRPWRSCRHGTLGRCHARHRRGGRCTDGRRRDVSLDMSESLNGRRPCRWLRRGGRNPCASRYHRLGGRNPWCVHCRRKWRCWGLHNLSYRWWAFGKWSEWNAGIHCSRCFSPHGRSGFTIGFK